jgi:hypothetical protein
VTGIAGRDWVHIGQIELDLLATHAGVAVPFPLRVPSFGRIPAERDLLLATAGQTLWLRGLADADGPRGLAAEIVTALRKHRGAIDLVLTDPQRTVGVVALVYGSWALLCAQTLDDDPAGPITVWRGPEMLLTDEVHRLIPRRAAANVLPITLPGAIVHPPEEIDERRLREQVREHGGDPVALDQLVGVLPSVAGQGQLGVTRGGLRAGPELSWLDGPRGRVGVRPTDGGWVSVNPLRPANIHAALSELVTIARAPR